MNQSTKHFNQTIQVKTVVMNWDFRVVQNGACLTQVKTNHDTGRIPTLMRDHSQVWMAFFSPIRSRAALQQV